ncbi:omptin family outer membrane protease [Ancylobacter sp. FA202]|uniref:omptin family outer membrane protease n=1 Tax=Ancylobacter sp. FA202 TaxID=1111106 RepID=UPI0003775023|nr:omptin family outer membrane protease [Ancylobacter sp. FA202]
MARSGRSGLIGIGLYIAGMGAVLAADNASPVLPEQLLLATPGEEVILKAGFGYTWITANEYVYEDGNRISRLIWESQAPVVTAALKVELVENVVFSANGKLGFSGSSHMRDFDWVGSYVRSYAAQDWTHYSTHPSTSLDHYVDIDAALGRRFTLGEGRLLTLQAGFKYTDIKWTANDGPYLYSRNGFRDTAKLDYTSLPAIDYQQRYAGLFVGAETELRHEAWTLTALVKGGVTFSANDTDHHYFRQLRFEDDIGTLPFLTVGARADYALSASAGFYLGVELDTYFRGTGDATMYDNAIGELLDVFKDGSGMDFQATTVSAGFRLAF